MARVTALQAVELKIEKAQETVSKFPCHTGATSRETHLACPLAPYVIQVQLKMFDLLYNCCTLYLRPRLATLWTWSPNSKLTSDHHICTTICLALFVA